MSLHYELSISSCTTYWDDLVKRGSSGRSSGAPDHAQFPTCVLPWDRVIMEQPSVHNACSKQILRMVTKQKWFSQIKKDCTLDDILISDFTFYITDIFPRMTDIKSTHCDHQCKNCFHGSDITAL